MPYVIRFFILLSVVLLAACCRTPEPKVDLQAEENKAIVRRYLMDVWSEGNLSLVNEIFSRDFVGYTSGKESERGIEGVKQLVSRFRTAFPDIHYTLEDEIVERDKVVTRWTARATHKGDWAGITPTNKQVIYTGMNIFRIAGGKIVEEYFEFDSCNFLQQLGAVPPPAHE